ncbi:MAG: polymerase sigma-70 factor, subfamily [Mycobacterium sp.]|nr:polymerase sigma-70 factor, subfamily [Mycobacterium sp.]
MSDDDLIQAAREGRDYAGPFLVSMFGPRLLGYCKSIASDLSDTDCERVVELAIEKAVRKIDAFDPTRGKFEAWLRTFVLHATQDWRRGNQRLLSLEAENGNGRSLSETIASDPVIDQPDGDSRLVPASQALRDLIPELNVPDQVIIGLRDIEGRSVKDVAALLDISEAACRQRHHRAKLRLKQLLVADPRVAAIISGEPA